MDLWTVVHECVFVHIKKKNNQPWFVSVRPVQEAWVTPPPPHSPSARSRRTHIALSMSSLWSSPSLLASRKRPLTASEALAWDELSWTMARDREERAAELGGGNSSFMSLFL